MRTLLLLLLLGLAATPASLLSQSDNARTHANLNPEFKYSNYVQFLEKGGKVKIFRTAPVGVLSMKSANVLGGYLFTIHEAYDEESQTRAYAVMLMPNNSRAVSKFLLDAARIIARLPSSFMSGDCYVIDKEELPSLIATLERFASYRNQKPLLSTHYTYTCDGGLAMAFGYEVNRDKNGVVKSGWRSIFGISGEMYDDDFIDRLIDILKESQKALKQFDH